MLQRDIDLNTDLDRISPSLAFEIQASTERPTVLKCSFLKGYQVLCDAISKAKTLQERRV